MKKKILFSLLLITGLLSSCNKSTENNLSWLVEADCSLLTEGLLIYDRKLVAEEMEKLLKDLTPSLTNLDQIGHKENFETLKERLENCESLTITSICYACIETYPYQTELFVTIDSSGTNVRRVIDVFTAEVEALSFAGMHN